MPILKMEGRLWHLAKMIKQSECWIDNEEICAFPEVKKQRKEMRTLPPFAWVSENELVIGYRPYGIFMCISGGLVIGNAVSWMLPFFIGSGDAFWFWLFALTLTVGGGMVYYGLFSRLRRFIAFDRVRGLVHFSRPIWGSYISVPWKDAHFMKIRWHVPKGWRPGKNDVDFFYFLHPPFRSPSSYLLSYVFRKQIIAPGASPDKIWWLVFHFMNYCPGHQKEITKMLEDINENCQACFAGDMAAMQRYVGTKTKVYPGIGSTDLYFDYGKDWKHLDMTKLPKAPTHVIGPDGKWKKLKKPERDNHVPGPAWESLTPE